MLCAEFGRNWPSGSAEEDFQISSMYFHYFRNYLPLEKDVAIHLNKIWIHFAPGCFVTSLVEICLVVLEKRFLNFVIVFLLFRNYHPLENSMVLHLNKLESPLPRDAFCEFYLKLAQWFWRRRWKCEKIRTTTTKTTTTSTDKGHIVFRKAYLSSSLRLRWAKNLIY